MQSVLVHFPEESIPDWITISGSVIESTDPVDTGDQESLIVPELLTVPVSARVPELSNAPVEEREPEEVTPLEVLPEEADPHARVGAWIRIVRSVKRLVSRVFKMRKWRV